MNAINPQAQVDGASRLLGFLCWYLSPIMPIVSLLVGDIKRNAFVRRHALLALAAFCVLAVVMVLWLCAFFGFLAATDGGRRAGGDAALMAMTAPVYCLSIGYSLAMIVFAIMAALGKPVNLPVLGPWADRRIAQFPG